MKLRKLLLWFIFIDFTIFSTWVMWQVGYVGIWQAGFESPASLQILLDLAICCVIFCIWMKRDAEARNINPYPWMAFVFTSGSIGVLAYLIAREYKKVDKEVLQVA